MRIKQRYNNNIVLAINDEHEEIVLIGKGLAFGMEKGDIVPRNKIEKQFELKGEAKYKFQEMIQDTPLDFIIASEEIIAFIKQKYQKKLSDTIYVTLTDHIVNTVERIRMGINFDNILLGNVKQLYHEEYEIGLEAVAILRKQFDIKIDDSEANFIALHIINAQLDSDMMQIYTITEIINEISNILNQHFKVNCKNNFAYDRFITHCRFFVQRVLNYTDEENGTAFNHEMLELMKAKYERQTSCVNEICDYIEKKYSYKVNQDEQLYLMMHMVKLTS